MKTKLLAVLSEIRLHDAAEGERDELCKLASEILFELAKLRMRTAHTVAEAGLVPPSTSESESD